MRIVQQALGLAIALLVGGVLIGGAAKGVGLVIAGLIVLASGAAILRNSFGAADELRAKVERPAFGPPPPRAVRRFYLRWFPTFMGAGMILIGAVWAIGGIASLA